MAEIHLIGQIHSAVNFEEPNLFCKWSFQFGKFFLFFCYIISGFSHCAEFSEKNLGSNWKLIEGVIEGQTATSRGRIANESAFVHPIDIHLACRGIQGWPKVHIEVYAVNALGNSWPVGSVLKVTVQFNY